MVMIVGTRHVLVLLEGADEGNGGWDCHLQAGKLGKVVGDLTDVRSFRPVPSDLTIVWRLSLGKPKMAIPLG